MLFINGLLEKGRTTVTKSILWGILAGFFFLSVQSSDAKIYVWEDEKGCVHYANNEERVPPAILEDESRHRVIETTARTDSGSGDRTPGQVQQAAAPPTPATPAMGAPGTPQPEAAAAAISMQEQYRDILLKMRDYRKSNRNLNTPEYKALQERLLDLRKEMATARPMN